MTNAGNMPEPVDQVVTSEAGAAVIAPTSPRRANGWDLLVRGRANKICLLIVAIYLLIGLVSLLPSPRQVPVLRDLPGVEHIHSLNELIDFKYQPDVPYAPPSWSYTDPAGTRHLSPSAWLGFDFQGHSVFWQVLYGARHCATYYRSHQRAGFIDRHRTGNGGRIFWWLD